MKLSDFFKTNFGVGIGPSPVNFLPNFLFRKQNLPNDSGSYKSPVLNPQNNPATPPTPPANLPDPKATADAIFKTVSGGTIPAYSASQFQNPNPSSIQAGATASELNNARNDIATGTTDPYKWASQSGIPYTAAELKAIEKATAGVYDPAINSALARLDHAQKMEEKAATGAGTGVFGDYVEGQNPVVDSWIQRISRGEATLADIKGASKEVQALRNAVNLGLNTVKYRNSTATGNLATVNQLNTLLANPKLSRISGLLGSTFLGGIAGGAKTAKTDFDQIKSKLELTAASLLKGQGQVSNFERDILEKASSNLHRGLPDSEFKKRLIQMRGVLQNSSGLPAVVKITTPDGGVQYSNATTEDVNQAIIDGATVEYVDEKDIPNE